MKKSLSIIALMFLLAACSAAEETTEKVNEEPVENEAAMEEESSGIGVDKGLLNVEVTIPAEFFEEDELAEVVAEAEEEESKAATVNDDGSVTYKMSKGQHKEMMKEMEKELKESVEELINNDDLPSIYNVTHTKKFTEYEVTVDQEAFENSFDGFAILGLAMSGMFYQLYDGVPADKMNVQIHTVDKTTGERIGTVNYPEAFEEMEDEDI